MNGLAEPQRVPPAKGASGAALNVRPTTEPVCPAA